MDFDVIIYGIIGIVWVIVSIVQANQKAKKRKLAVNKTTRSKQSELQHASGTNGQKNIEEKAKSNERIENWLAELMGVESNVEPQKEQIFSEQKQTIQVVPEQDIIDDEEEDKAFKSTVENEVMMNTSNFVSQDYEEDILSDFDLRKAVIYSEILKRPYN